ncbi:hypothetical protein J3E64_002855 [Sphingobium sp. OAS761]|uniref:hypothetical protein n=1 Tax=Sphingobium sp. OAS761 TaxID=2817901 RepID=UPI0020A02774|nr:hypothetical protein [Sphingobium sp. OAS761]MCP1471151.1 hypothetical protein [Sphingobium sp. OAS761]
MRFGFYLGAIALAAPAHAETFDMVGHFPAPYRDVSLARSFGIDRISGRDGAALAVAIEDRLAHDGPDGRPYYDLIALSRRGPDADAILSGTADATIRESDVKRKVDQCVEQDGDRCNRKEKVEATCLQETVSFSSTLRVARGEDGRILYSQSRPQTETLTTCPGDKGKRTPRESIRRMVKTAADRFVADIVPRHERYKVRLREGREGMDKPTGEAFKASVKLSQRDPDAACAQWGDMDGAQPGQPSLLFNLGLCAERTGAYGKAERFYAQAGQALGRGDFNDDMKRVRDLTVGRDDAAARMAGD